MDERRPTRGSTRDAILDATDHLLETVGFRRVTMEDIAREAGCSRRAVYTYFPTKAEVGLSSIDRVIERTHARLCEIAAEEGDPRDKLLRMLVTRVLFRIDTVRPYRQSLDELFEAVRPAYMARRGKHFAREVEILSGVLEEGRRAGIFAPGDAAQTAMTLVRATNAFLPYSLSAEELGRRADLASGITKMAELLIRGLSAEVSPKT